MPCCPAVHTNFKTTEPLDAMLSRSSQDTSNNAYDNPSDDALLEARKVVVDIEASIVEPVPDPYRSPVGIMILVWYYNRYRIDTRYGNHAGLIGMQKKNFFFGFL